MRQPFRPASLLDHMTKLAKQEAFRKEEDFYHEITWLIDRATKNYNRQFRNHCMDLFGEQWRKS